LAARPLPLRADPAQIEVDAPVHAIDGAIWLRISAHAYNEIEDYDRLAEIVCAL
jgi:isopenicillin-N epimerase